MYVCTNAFKDSNGRMHYPLSEITGEMYDRLLFSEKKNFSYKHSSASMDESNTFSNYPSSSLVEFDPLPEPEPNPLPSFGGFLGGQSGGGGATGSWEPEPDPEPTAEDCWDGDSSDSD